MSLYPDYRPRGVRKGWDHCSMEARSAGAWLAGRAVPKDWGIPTDAAAWFAENGNGALRIMVADYPNGRRVTVRCRKHDRQIEFSTPANAVPA